MRGPPAGELQLRPGVDPMFAVLDENESAILLDDIVHDALATIEAPLSALFAHYDAFRDRRRRCGGLSLVSAEYAPLTDDPDAAVSAMGTGVVG